MGTNLRIRPNEQYVMGAMLASPEWLGSPFQRAWGELVSEVLQRLACGMGNTEKIRYYKFPGVRIWAL